VGGKVSRCPVPTGYFLGIFRNNSRGLGSEFSGSINYDCCLYIIEEWIYFIEPRDGQRPAKTVWEVRLNYSIGHRHNYSIL
jgi:hypothetical protein